MDAECLAVASIILAMLLNGLQTKRRNEMTEVCVNGLVFVFYDDDALMEWLDAHADEVREE